MMTFGHALDAVIRICEEHEASKASIERYCVVRDVKGRIRLVVRLTGNKPTGLEALQDALQRELGAYFVGPILSTESSAETQRLATKLLERAKDKWPNRWPSEAYSALGIASKLQTKTRWTGLERTIGKEAWLADSPPEPPWPLRPGKTPPIVTFHSFKGGVGRTTLVAAFALELAAQEPAKRIAVIDLDLEAPGVGSLFGVETERGVLDILVDHLATDTIELVDASAPAPLPGKLRDRVTVFPAGRLDDSYLQKLARLDFSSAQPDSSNPVGLALLAMLEKMRADFDFILLDSRAGLHDLAGMSLHGLAHLDVLVFRGTEQNFAGLGQTLRTLGPRSYERLVLVETMLPANPEEAFQLRRERTREHVYRLLSEHVYVPEDPELPDSPDPPQPADLGEPHDVIHVRRREWLDGLDSVSDKVADILRDEELRAVGERILDRLGLEADDPEEELA
jgi:MinD-like ATPase involved in chromosome partitioning or flagellar assembly